MGQSRYLTVKLGPSSISESRWTSLENPLHAAHTSTRYDLEPTETVLCIKTMSLATSEHNPQKRQELVVVGTTLLRGEDLPSQGRLYVFDIIDVVPEPDRPATGHKLKLITKEEVKGAVTALSEIGQEGFLLATQGQKCMVRGLKEDRTLLPVAFMDMQCYVSCAKELKGTGLCVMGDPIKGVSFVGYSVCKPPSSLTRI